MHDDWDAVEAMIRTLVEGEDAWIDLVAAAHVTTDSWTFWTCAFDAAVAARRTVLADLIMRERIERHEDFCAQPWLMTDHALVLEQLGRLDEALDAVRSAIGDDPFDDALYVIEQRLLAEGGGKS